MFEPASATFTVPELVPSTIALVELLGASADDCEGGTCADTRLSGVPLAPSEAPLDWMGMMLLADASVEAMVDTSGMKKTNNQELDVDSSLAALA